MVQYYLGTIIFHILFFYPVDWEINDDVHSGNFFSILIKPVTFYKYYFCKMLGDRLAYLLFIIIPVILFSSVYYKNELLTIEILILGKYCNYSIYGSMVFNIMLCRYAFFLVRKYIFVLTVKEIVIQFLSGILLPFKFFSNNFRLFLDVLPFKYLVYEPLHDV